MATAPIIRKKNAVYQQNVNKRGHVKPSLIKDPNAKKIPLTYWAFGILLFAVLGGAILQILDIFL
ncbi:hypothetical protein BCR43DRAFT_493142 [Syncephalastrum racemosum]|uniref:Stress-associated endoplasmic reticulum protein n=1 Tax=Syncephalastrum racemosum TaxID=13706 RepID=A0A1X2HA68_SYNRA|nr:hypothetical protein BCR43DRAFT_493142 [Syncephalastrum racemosum]